MRVLGAVLAGGRASRFGSDKALAELNGVALIAHVVAALERQAEAVVVCGRSDPRWRCLADAPTPGFGPLGGLAAALLAARREGYDAVLSAPCDAPVLPDLRAVLGEPDAHVEALPVAGLWRAHHAEVLLQFLREDPRRSVRGWAARIGARAVALAPIANVNTPADLAALSGPGTRA